MSKIVRENSITMIKNTSKVPLNENLAKHVSSNNSNKPINSSKERQFGRDITTSINNKVKLSNEGKQNIQSKYNEMKKVFSLLIKGFDKKIRYKNKPYSRHV